VVVVNEAGPASLPRSELTKIFLRKSPELVAVDQRKESPARSAFSRSVLGRPVAAIASYWQQQIFSGGEAPPVEKSSDSDVLAYVRANPKAVGYVAAGTELGGGVKALDVR
jgi:ABC-type phosphate transport system substrate-binding protein